MNRRLQLAIAAIVLLLGHVVALALTPPGLLAAEVSDSFQFAVAALTVVACFHASRRSAGFARSFWAVVGASFAVWSIGIGIQIYYELMGLPSRMAPIEELLPFFLSFSIMFLAVFRSSLGTQRDIDWTWVLDAIQITVLVLGAYLFLVYVPTMQYGQVALAPLRLRLLEGRNILLVIGLTARALWTRGRADRPLFAPVALAMAVYALASWLGNNATVLQQLGSGNWYDLAWTVPFTMVTMAATRWQDRAPDLSAQTQTGGLPAVMFVYLPSLLLPVLMLAMYNQVVREQVIVGLSALIISIVCYSLRLVVMHNRQQRILDALARSERRYRSLFETNVAGVYRSTFDGRMLDCNQKICDVLGYSREELLALPMSTIYPGGQAEREAFKAEMLSAPPGAVERSYLRKDGKLIWAMVSNTVGKDDNGNPVLEGTLLDVTERHQLQHQLRQAQKMEAIGRLAGGIAHDFNNVLTVIEGYSEMLMTNASPTDPGYAEAGEIHTAAARAAALTQQLLAFSRQQVLRPEVVNLNLILGGLEKMLRRLIQEDIELRTVLAPSLGSVKVDPGQIEQIVLNLVVNARDAMPDGGKLTLETQNVTLDAEYAELHPGSAAGPYVLLAVSDNGIGMDADTRSRIFEPFYTTKEQGKGTGLGLATVYGIVSQSGGNIEVYSEPGKGTTFKIYVPQFTGVAASPAHAAPEPAHTRGSETILLVEDDAALRELARKALLHHGYNVLAPSRPEDAEAMCVEQQGPLHLLLTDVVMPHINGREVARRVSLHRPGIKVLFMSGYTTNSIVHHGVLDEGLSFLPKPFTPSTLLAKVREVLDQVPQ